MGGAGYSDKANWQIYWNVSYNEDQFTQMNQSIARKINMYVYQNPSTDVPAIYTNAAIAISDEMLMTMDTFLKESSTTDPPEFVHYKIPHFTDDHKDMLNSIKLYLGHAGGVSS